MLISNQAVKMQRSKPRQSELSKASEEFNGRTDFEIKQDRIRKHHKQWRGHRHEWIAQ